MEKIGGGRRGNIEIYNQKNKKIARKTALKGKESIIQKEIFIIKKLNQYGINFVPQIQYTGENFFEYEFIEGIHFSEAYENQNKNKNLMLDLLYKAYCLDRCGIIHGELMRPYKNIIVGEQNKIYIIDFERGKYGDFSGKNLKLLSQWIKNEGFLSIKDLKTIGQLKNPDEIYQYIKRKIKKPKLYSLLSIILGFVSLDLLTKWIFYNKSIGEQFIFLNPAFNEGIARGVQIDMTIIMLISFISFFVFWFVYNKNWISGTVLILFVAGALGNLIDRLFLGGVRDFIMIGDFPIFNIADIYLSIAISILIWEEIIFPITHYLLYRKGHTGKDKTNKY
ncbi:signal peptidase II [Candidatus Absconditicoccus praedator]|uniref:signal peptidase II n=1 Tax=Candidatus Absconditicoccus praedator TaxID=2735562 RepID=UPI001E503819|nr:signal peptidase II [Candidatus Absconditicoccus praedator]UFX83022.1 signal peptidase II [Candidatus Absconditicoccus praedator]